VLAGEGEVAVVEAEQLALPVVEGGGVAHPTFRSSVSRS
jgi:hypothetical protein